MTVTSFKGHKKVKVEPIWDTDVKNIPVEFKNTAISV